MLKRKLIGEGEIPKGGEYPKKFAPQGDDISSIFALLGSKFLGNSPPPGGGGLISWGSEFPVTPVVVVVALTALVCSSSCLTCSFLDCSLLLSSTNCLERSFDSSFFD